MSTAFSTAILGLALLGQAPDHAGGGSHLVVPQARAFAMERGREAVRLAGVRAEVTILEQAATTALEVTIENRGARPEEAELLVPVPEGAVVRSFLFEGTAGGATARLLPRDEAKALYESIVRRVRDPALLEFAGYNLIRSSVFPVPPGGTQRVRLTYEHLAAADGARIDYVLPRTESLAAAGAPWQIEVRIRSARPIATVYSPSHPIATEHPSPGEARVRVQGREGVDPGPFRLSYLLQGDGVTASLLGYPDPGLAGGYFLLLAGLPADIPAHAGSLRRELILVLDRSGSMAGEKLEQARAAALQVLEGLAEGESFNIIDYASDVALFSPRPVMKDRRTMADARGYLRGIRASSGTNLHDALLEALRQPRADDASLPLVLFLTDGLPTVGVTGEAAIRSAAERANVHRRRVFTFGVGYDVNTPLLLGLARSTRATSAFVLPGENVEMKVSQVFERLQGPVLADAEIEALDPEGRPTTRAMRDLFPARLPDLFRGDQLVLLGRYVGEGPLSLRLKGNYLGRPREFRFGFDLERASVRNTFVPRLWASRKIASLVEEIRDRGAEAGLTSSAGSAGSAAADPRFRELVDEIVSLSTQHGILTEYTSFLALEGTNLARKDLLDAHAGRELVGKALGTRSGIGSVNQDRNISEQSDLKCLNRYNEYWDDKMKRVQVASIQQVHDRTFYKRGNSWVDARLIEKHQSFPPDQVIEFGSEGHCRLVERLAAEGRQGMLALPGETLLEVDGKSILVKEPAR